MLTDIYIIQNAVQIVMAAIAVQIARLYRHSTRKIKIYGESNPKIHNDKKLSSVDTD